MFMLLAAPNNSVRGAEVFGVYFYQKFSHFVAGREALPLHFQNYYFVCELNFIILSRR